MVVLDYKNYKKYLSMELWWYDFMVDEKYNEITKHLKPTHGRFLIKYGDPDYLELITDEGTVLHRHIHDSKISTFENWFKELPNGCETYEEAKWSYNLNIRHLANDCERVYESRVKRMRENLMYETPGYKPKP